MGFPDNDYLLLRDEPGYHGGEVPDDEDEPMPLGERGMNALMHDIRGARTVRASFAIDTTTGAVSEVAL